MVERDGAAARTTTFELCGMNTLVQFGPNIEDIVVSMHSDSPILQKLLLGVEIPHCDAAIRIAADYMTTCFRAVDAFRH